jgi:hypothetical protein
MADQSIDMLITVGVICLVIVGVVALINWLGIQVPRIVYIILAIIIGIVALVWLGGALKSLV